MQIIELTSEDQIIDTFPLIKQLYVDLTEKEYTSYINELFGLGYRRIVMKEGDQYVSSAGFLVGVHLHFGKYIYINDLITEETHRSHGLGHQMMDWIEEEGKKLGCNNITLSSNVNRHDTHRFYFRNGFHIHGYYFMKKINK